METRAGNVLENTHGCSRGDSLMLTMAYDGTGRRVSKTRFHKACISDKSADANSSDGVYAADWERELVTHYTGIGTEVRESFHNGTPSETKVVVNMPQGLGRYGVEDAEKPSSGNATFEWYLKNHLGSTMLVYGTGDGAGSVKAAYDYRAFGEQVTLSEPTEKVTENFTGKERDDETELNYFGARYLDPMIGMWTSVDPARQFSSPYLYAGNGVNPINSFDPDGNRVFGTYNRSTGEVYLQDENPERGSYTFHAFSGWHDNQNAKGGPIPLGNYAIINDPWKGRKNWFGLYNKDDGKFDDFVQDENGVAYRGQMRLHRFSSGTDGCISAKTENVEDYLGVVNWIKGTETKKIIDADGIERTDYGEIEAVSDDE
ncbi:MAG: RHS repeat-associated core domain-containing protein [Fibrobacter sp.]|nr:RHS repeat-associated core domain-containing protein [Fibrobacter sp.]